MGVDVAFRLYLVALLKRRTKRLAFHATLPEHEASAPFDVIIVDLMQELAVIKGAAAGEALGSDIQRRITESLARLLQKPANSPPDEVAAGRLVIGCLDNSYQVPRNKAAVETQRDAGKHKSPILASSAEYDAVVRRAAEQAGRDARAKHRLTSSVADTDAAEQEAVARFSDAAQFLVTRGPLPADGAQVWRNVSLSWQLKRLVTEGVLGMTVPAGRRLLLDEGIPLDEERYREFREHMLRTHGTAEHPSTGISAHQRAALVGNLMKSMLRRIVLLPDGTRHTLPATGLGESDNKILYYVQRRLPLGLTKSTTSGKIRYLVKCQDTDVMWQLLSHMRSLINPATGQIDEVDVWMDTQTPQDRSKGVAREYRFINVVELWRQVHDWLGEEFPALRNPLETLLFVVFCNGNDYIERFPAHMKIGPATIWNIAMELLALGSGRAKYPSSTGSPANVNNLDGAYARLGHCMNNLMRCGERGIDRDAVLADRAHLVPDGNPALHVYHAPIGVNVAYATRFFYALIQRSASLRKAAREFGDKTWPITSGAFVGDTQELLDSVALLHMRETAAALAAATAEAAAAAAAAPPETPPAAPKAVFVPPLFDVPVGVAMEARVARVAWVLDYYFNGWKSPAYAYNWFLHTGEYSRHGWKVVDVTGTPHGQCDSQYLYAEYHPPIADADAVLERPGHYLFLQPSLAHEVSKASA